MGNQQFKCPAGTTYGAAPMSCVMSCPDDYELRMVEGAQRCVSKTDPAITVHLVAQPMVMRPLDNHAAFTISDIDPTSDIGVRYVAEQKRFNEELALANLNIDHQKQVNAAAKAVLAAGGNDEVANAKYSSLTKDPNALDAMYREEIRKDSDKFISDYQFLNNQAMQQQQTLDLINSVKDNLVSVKDDMEYSVGTFDKQISDIRNQININKKTREQATDYGKWIGVGLNFAIVLALLFMLFIVGRKVMGSTRISLGTADAPARPAASEHTVELLKGLTGLLSASGDSAKKQ